MPRGFKNSSRRISPGVVGGRRIFTLVPPTSVVVRDPYLNNALVRPREDDAPLVVDSDAVEARQTTLQRLQAVSGRAVQVREVARIFQHVELPPHHASHQEPCQAFPRPAVCEELRRRLVAERSNSQCRIYLY